MKLDAALKSIAQVNPAIQQVSGDFIPLPPKEGHSDFVLYVNCVYRKPQSHHDFDETVKSYRADSLLALKLVNEYLSDETFVSTCLSFFEPAGANENIRVYRTGILKEDLSRLALEPEMIIANEIVYKKI
jgi:hypothetical protein